VIFYLFPAFPEYRRAVIIGETAHDFGLHLHDNRFPISDSTHLMLDELYQRRVLL
jgi:hypothetical protein